MALLDDMPRGVEGRYESIEMSMAQKAQKLPGAVWAAEEKIGASSLLRYDSSKVFLGVVNGQTGLDKDGEIVVEGGHMIGIGDDRHVLLCAGSRAGKGRSCLIPTILEYGLGERKGSVIALDPKGELANVTARNRKKAGQRVCIVDPFGVTAGRLEDLRVGFNPLAELERASGRLIEDCGLIADALVVADGKDPHWSDSARTLLEGLILHVATTRKYESNRNLVTVRDLLMKGADFEYFDKEENKKKTKRKMTGLKLEIARNAGLLEEEGEDDIAAALDAVVADFFDRPQSERGSVLSTARRQTHFLQYPKLRASLVEDDFRLKDLKAESEGLTVFLCLPASLMGTCNRWFRLFVNLLLTAMEHEATEPDLPVLAVLEELAVVGYLKNLEVAAGLAAGFSVKFIFVLQDLTQLKKHYREGWETFVGNCGTSIFFGNSDLTTLDFISKRCGQTFMVVDRGSEVAVTQKVKSGAMGESWGIEVRDLLTAEEASRYLSREDPEQRQLIIRSGAMPMLLHRIKYDKHPHFAGKAEAPGE